MRVAVIADEITGAGWRLAGARVLTPEPAELGEHFRAALLEADLVLITAAMAAAVPDLPLRAALLSERPLLLVISDLGHLREPPDLEVEVRRTLGMAQ